MGVAAHTCNPRIPEDETGDTQLHQLGLHSKTLTQKGKNQTFLLLFFFLQIGKLFLANMEHRRKAQRSRQDQM